MRIKSLEIVLSYLSFNICTPFHHSKKKKITPSFSPIYFMQWYSFLFDIKVYTLHVPGQGQLWRVLCIITYMSSQFNKRTNTEAIHLHKSLLTDSLSNYINFPCIFSCWGFGRNRKDQNIYLGNNHCKNPFIGLFPSWYTMISSTHC